MEERLGQPMGLDSGNQSQGPLNGGVSKFPDLDLSFLFCPFSSLLGLSRFFRSFPICPGTLRGFFPTCPFPLFLGLLTTPTRNSPERVRGHNQDFSRKKWEAPWFGNPPVLASKPTNRQRQQYSGTALGRLRVRLVE